MPSGCQTITVSGASVSDVNGSYTFDATTEAWINDNNVEWTLEKTWWEADSLSAGVPATSGFRWSFQFSGTTQPPGAVTVRLLRHPTLMPHAYSGLPAVWAPNSAHDLNGTICSPSVNPNINPIFFDEWVPVRVDLKRYDDEWHTNLLDTGTMDIDFSNVEGYSGTGTPTTVQWAAAMSGRDWFEFGNDSYTQQGTFTGIVPNMVRFRLSTSGLHGNYWEKEIAGDTRIFITHNQWTGGNSLGQYFVPNSGVSIDWTTYDSVSGTKWFWEITGVTNPGTRAFNQLVYPDKDATGANYDLLTEGFTSGVGWSASAPLNNYPLNIVDANNGSSPWASNYIQFGYGSSWGIDLGMAPDGGETCPSDAVWTGTGITVSAGTGSAGSAPSAPTTFTATLDLTSIPPSAPTTFTATVNLTSIPPSAPTWDTVVADSDGTPPDDLTDDFPLDPNVDTDSDGDFIPDEFDAFPSDPTEWLDTDGDGTGDNADTPTGRPDDGNDPGDVWPNWVGWTKAPKYRGYVYDEKSRSLSGPFVSGDLTALTSVRNGGSLLGVSSENKIVSTDLVDFRDRDFPEPLTDPWEDIRTHPSSDCDCFVVGNKGGRFAYRGRYLESPFAAPKVGSFEIGDPMCFTDGHLAIAETAWMHLGNEHNNKQVHRLDFNFSTGSYGHVWAYVQSDSEQGKVSGQYKGLIKDNVRVFVNVRGRRFRVRLFVATHKSYPWNLREMAVGYLVGKSF